MIKSDDYHEDDTIQCDSRGTPPSINDMNLHDYCRICYLVQNFLTQTSNLGTHSDSRPAASPSDHAARLATLLFLMHHHLCPMGEPGLRGLLDCMQVGLLPAGMSHAGLLPLM